MLALGAALRNVEGGRTWSGVLLLSTSVFWVTGRLAPYSSVSPHAAYMLAFAAVVCATLAVAATVPPGRRTSLGISAIALGVLFGSQQLAATLPTAAAMGVLAALLALGSSLGAWVGSGIQQPGHLLFVALVAGIADTFSVTQPEGISAAIVARPEALALAALPWPMLGTRDIVPILGVGDVVFTSLYWTASRKHALALDRTLLALLFGFTLTLGLVLWFERPIPVLPFLGACVLAVHPPARAPSPEDRRRGAWVVTGLAVVIAAWVLRRSF
jgi:uncharacterized membrane protein